MSHSAKVYAALVAAGLCGRCGKRRPDKNKKTCQECADVRDANRKKWYDARVADGLCTRCGKSRDGAQQRCSTCRKIDGEILRRFRDNQKLEVFNAYGGP